MSDKKKNPFAGIAAYFKEVRSELKKVVWPTLKQIQNNTIIVIVCILIVGAIIAVLDLGFGTTLGKIVDIAGENQTKQTTPLNTDEQMPIEIPEDSGTAPEVEDGADTAPQQSNEQ